MESLIDTALLNNKGQHPSLSHQIIFVSHELDFSSIVDDPNNKRHLFDCQFVFATSKIMELLADAHAGKRIALVINARWAEGNHLRLLRKIASLAGYPHIPVLVVSDRIHMSMGDSFIEAGADDYLKCPPTFERLEQILQFYWEQKPAIEAAKANLLSSHSEKTPTYKASFIKRFFDILGAATGIVLLSPIFVLTALAIKLESPGSVFYCSLRVGSGGRVFNFWKFRSMFVNADKQLAALTDLNQYGHNALFVKLADDPRVTRTGRFIRKYSIDELPQLFNVLIGDMSLVGNRPLPVYEAETLLHDDYSCQRFMAPAGITGLWQVSKRGKSDMSDHERIQLDVQYSTNSNFANDFKLLLLTTTAFIQKENV